MFNVLNSKEPSEISRSEEYISFRSTVPQKRVIVDEEQDKVWTLYDAGPQNITAPLICLPPVSGTADVFFKQLMPLSARGYRVISVQYPVYWTMKEWITGFRRLLDYLNLDKVHIFGASLGGYLAQKFAELCNHSQRVQSIILCNSFCDTTIFNYTDSAVLFWMTPSLILKRMVMGNLNMGLLDSRIADTVDFIVEKLESLTQPELASRLTLNCINSYIQPHKLQGIPITILDVFDKSALSASVRECVYKSYPDAKRAHLKTGGNFPFLSRSEEVNMHIQVHLRQFQHSRYRACEIISEEESSSGSNEPSPNEREGREMDIFERSL